VVWKRLREHYADVSRDRMPARFRRRWLFSNTHGEGLCLYGYFNREHAFEHAVYEYAKRTY